MKLPIILPDDPGAHVGVHGRRPEPISVQLSAAESGALVMLRDTMFPGQSVEMVARKLIQDELIRAGALGVPRGARGLSGE
jgi:hypothetical protein